MIARQLQHRMDQTVPLHFENQGGTHDESIATKESKDDCKPSAKPTVTQPAVTKTKRQLKINFKREKSPRSNECHECEPVVEFDSDDAKPPAKKLKSPP